MRVPDLKRDVLEMYLVDDGRAVFAPEIILPDGAADCDATRVCHRRSSGLRYPSERNHRVELHEDGVVVFADVRDDGFEIPNGIPSGNFDEEFARNDVGRLFECHVDCQHFVPGFSFFGSESIRGQRDEFHAARQCGWNQCLECAEIGTGIFAEHDSFAQFFVPLEETEKESERMEILFLSFRL